MVIVGKYNKLKVLKFLDFGAYLDGEEKGEILLPIRYVPDGLNEGDELEVFIYLDSEDRIIATTEKPFAIVEEFASLKVKSVNSVGAFLDWGLMKDLLLPYREQRGKVSQGDSCLVYIYLDVDTGRIVASARLEKFIDNLPPTYQTGEEVSLIIESESLLGYNAIINHLHRGILYHDELPRPYHACEKLKGYIKKVREDGKIDLSLYRPGYDQVTDVTSRILERLKKDGGFLPLTDKSDAALIFSWFSISKKVFKKAIGALYKQRTIMMEENGIRLVKR